MPGDKTGIGFRYEYWNNKMGKPSNLQEGRDGSSGSSAA
jgi:hypothetical protein